MSRLWAVRRTAATKEQRLDTLNRYSQREYEASLPS